MKKISAFTLAEILITLAVIGIVAALTIPGLIQKYQERITVTKLKKAYSALQQAYLMASIEYGTPDKWSIYEKIPVYDENEEIIDYDMSGIEIQRKYLTKFLKGENCDRFYNCSSFPEDGSLYNLAMNNEVAYKEEAIDKFPLFKMDDGVILDFTNVQSSTCSAKDIKNNVCSHIEVFINTKKGLYRRGVTSFMFYLTKDGIQPAGYKNSVMYPFPGACNLTNSQADNGHGCTAWVLENENMDYLKCDDLSWDGKHSCN